VAGVPNTKPKAGEVVDEEAELLVDGVLVGDDDEMEVAVDSEFKVDVESEVEGKSEPVGIGMVPMVLAALIAPEGVVVGPDDVAVGAAPQSVAGTVTVDTTVTVTMLFLPMTTVGVAIPFVPEEVVVAEMGLETTDVGLRVGADDVVTEVDEDVEI